MENFSKQHIQEFVAGHKSRTLKFALLALPALYFVVTFFKTLSCQNGVLGCSTVDSVVVFPFYFLISSFVNQLGPVSYFLLYAFSSAVYLSIFYHFAGWFEQVYWRIKHPANFRLKRV
jgi:hypothetical protein